MMPVIRLANAGFDLFLVWAVSNGRRGLNDLWAGTKVNRKAKA